MHDPVFQALIAEQRAQRGGPESDTFCMQCHSPIASRTGQITPDLDFTALEGLAADAVSCEACHRTRSVERPYNAGLLIDAEPTLRGPLPEPEAPHAAEQSDLFTRSELCASCHDVRGAGDLKLESPYEEWLDSPAAAQGNSCQTCHMRPYQGRAAPALASPERELHRHGFRAIEEFELSDEGCEGTSLLCGAAELEATLSGNELSVRVTNLVEGHNFPTGSVFFRQAWLAVEVRDADGNLLFESGGLDADSDLHDLHDPQGRELDPQLQVFGGYLRDAEDQPTLFMWRAARLESHALVPLETREVTYRFSARPGMTSLYAVVRLRFRAFSPRLLRAIGLDDLIEDQKVIDIQHIEAKWTAQTHRARAAARE